VFFAKLLDDFCSAGGFVADGLATDLPFELGDQFTRKSVG
jgi:hypothetical protein